MKRLVLAVTSVLATAMLFATVAFAEPPAPRTDSDSKGQQAVATRPRYANTAERWRGRPNLRAAAGAHPADTTASEKVLEHLPSANFMLEGQFGGAFARGL